MEKLPVSKLKAFAKEHDVNLTGCVEKEHIVNALKAAGVCEDGSKVAPPEPAPAASQEPEPKKERTAAEKFAEDRGEHDNKVMLCEKDGSLKTDDLLKLKTCVGWKGSDDIWCTEFEELVEDHGCIPQEGLTIAAVMALAEATKDRLCQKGMDGIEPPDLDSELFGGGGASGVAKGAPPPAKRPRITPATPAAVDKKAPRCDGCEKRPADLAVVHCVNCKAFLCSKCNEDNHPTKLLKSHIRIEASKAAAASASGPPAAGAATARPVTATVPPPAAGFSALSIAKLKELAKYHGVNMAGCFDKDDLISALRSGGVPESASKDVPNPSQPAKAEAKATPQPATGPSTLTEEQRQEMKSKQQQQWEARRAQQLKQQEEAVAMYNKFRSEFVVGDLWELLTGIALWRNDTGGDRLFFINAAKLNGWPNVIEILQHGKNRMKVRGMLFDKATMTMKGMPWQTGWLDVANVVDKHSGKLLMTPKSRSQLTAEGAGVEAKRPVRTPAAAAVAPKAAANPPAKGGGDSLFGDIDDDKSSQEPALSRWGRFNKSGAPQQQQPPAGQPEAQPAAAAPAAAQQPAEAAAAGPALSKDFGTSVPEGWGKYKAPVHTVDSTDY